MVSKEYIQSVFDSFNKLNVLVLGDVMIDAYIWGQVKRLSPEAPVPIVDVTKRENRLGGAANVALNIQKMGANPILCGVVGKDDKGTLFYQMLEDVQLSTKGMLTIPDRLTTLKYRVIGNNTHLLRVDEETESPLSDNEHQKLFTHIKNICLKEQIDVIICEDYDKGVFTADFIQNIVAFAKGKGIFISVDPKKKNFSAYKGVDLFKPNFRELCEGVKVDLDVDNLPDILNVLEKFQIENRIKRVLLTLSEHGVLITEVTDGLFKYKKIPAHLRNISDVSGAGDTLISVASLCLATKCDMAFMAALSNLAGGIVCEYVGVVPVDKEHLMKDAITLLT